MILSTAPASCKPFREENAKEKRQGRRSRGALGGKPLIPNEEARNQVADATITPCAAVLNDA
ncbi:hypothetical protein GIY62_12480 [Burkholderia plantarii]|nr:hypothetical protein GIY62_12480 [Burkholderia plantarii]